MKYILGIIAVLLLSASGFSYAEDYSGWTKDHNKATPIWVLPKATAPANMQWTVPDMPGSHKAASFYSPEVCEGCHADIHEQWKGSMMANAWVDPVFLAVYFKYVGEAKDGHQKSEVAMCSRCHTPIGYLADDPARYSRKLEGVEATGISCDVCHSVSASAGMGNGAFIMKTGDADKGKAGTKYGPFKDSKSPFHKTAYSELHTRSEMCGMCHDVNHAQNIMAIENTYSEWRTGPYNTGDPATTVTCQDCHMRQTPDNPSTGSTLRPDVPGYAAPKEMGARERKHIWQHCFVGGNLAVTALLGHNPQAKMAEERLKHACTVEFLGGGKAVKGDIYRMSIKVTNSGAGHSLPTGLTFVREMWLDVTVTDAKGKTIYRSGALDEKGNIDPSAVIYKTIIGTGSQELKPTFFLPEAAEVLYDHRIRPKGYDVAEYVFDVPADAAGPLSYHAEVRYRSAPQSLANEVLGKDAPTLPIFDMGEAQGSIELM